MTNHQRLLISEPLAHPARFAYDAFNAATLTLLSGFALAKPSGKYATLNIRSRQYNAGQSPAQVWLATSQKQPPQGTEIFDVAPLRPAIDLAPGDGPTVNSNGLPRLSYRLNGDAQSPRPKRQPEG